MQLEGISVLFSFIGGLGMFLYGMLRAERCSG